jgi:hypothetical protein
MTRAIPRLGYRVVARCDEVVDVPEATGELVVDGGASFRIFNAYGVDIQDVGEARSPGPAGVRPGLQGRACRYRR